MAPSPKPPGQRRRRNSGQSQWRELPAEGHAGEIPDLPAKKPGWLPATRDWWKTIWRSPMAVAWLEADVDPLLRLARLKDLELRGDLPVMGFTAIQQLEDRFGLSPKSRRALQWEVTKGEEMGVVEELRPSGGVGAHLRAV